MSDMPLPSTTTTQEDLVTAGQRRINLIWEATQAFIAVVVVLSSIAVSVRGAEIPQTLSNALFLIVGFYFSRTNHAAIGGVGSKPVEKYLGR